MIHEAQQSLLIVTIYLGKKQKVYLCVQRILSCFGYARFSTSSVGVSVLTILSLAIHSPSAFQNIYSIICWGNSVQF